jgi:hypothetical protein
LINNVSIGVERKRIEPGRSWSVLRIVENGIREFSR